MNSPVVGYVGITHLGLNYAVAGAARGFKIVAYDNDEVLISSLSSTVTSIEEPQLQDLMIECRERIHFTSDPSELSHCDLVYISKDVPTDAFGNSLLTEVLEFIEVATSHMSPEACLVILCQVPPGFTDEVRWSKSKLVYQVETLIFGRAIERAMFPERFILGLWNNREDLPEPLDLYLKAFECPVLRMSYQSAELAKIAINMYMVSTVTTTNFLSGICEHIDAAWEDIIPALKLDERIGPHAYLKPGLGLSGGNLERDMSTILEMTGRCGLDAGLIKSWRSCSSSRKNWAQHKLRTLVLTKEASPLVAIWGLTYKEYTDSIKNSVAIDLIRTFPQLNFQVYDPAANNYFPTENVKRVMSRELALKNADTLMIMTPWPEFMDTKNIEKLTSMRGRVLIDPYRMLNGKKVVDIGFSYACLGSRFGRNE